MGSLLYEALLSSMTACCLEKKKKNATQLFELELYFILFFELELYFGTLFLLEGMTDRQIVDIQIQVFG